MPFRFKLGEPFDEGFKRIAGEQIERAQGQLRSAGNQPVAIHETRKSMKRVRALLRLFRPALGDDVFRDENKFLRDIAMRLSGARDQHVLRETVDKLHAKGMLADKRLLDALRRAIGAADGGRAQAPVKEAIGDLAAAQQRLCAAELRGDHFDLVGAGLQRSYRRARRAFATAYANPSDEAFHEWRKGTQHHWRQMTLLSRAWPDYLGARAAEARALSQILGDDHDLAMLVAFVHGGERGLSEEQVAAVETAARQAQAELRSAAKPRGERLFAGGARKLKKAVATYWKAASAIKESDIDVVIQNQRPTVSRTAVKRVRAS
jgi:CHAD domain-containing protein